MVVALPRLLSLLPPPLVLSSGSGPSIYFRSLSVAFVECFVNSHQQDGRFFTRRVRESKPQYSLASNYLAFVILASAVASSVVVVVIVMSSS